MRRSGVSGLILMISAGNGYSQGINIRDWRRASHERCAQPVRQTTKNKPAWAENLEQAFLIRARHQYDVKTHERSQRNTEPSAPRHQPPEFPGERPAPRL